jgi:hypothetical protein
MKLNQIRAVLTFGILIYTLGCTSPTQRKPSGVDGDPQTPLVIGGQTTVKVSLPDGSMMGFMNQYETTSPNAGTFSVTVSRQTTGGDLKECKLSVDLTDQANPVESCVAKKLVGIGGVASWGPAQTPNLTGPSLDVCLAAKDPTSEIYSLAPRMLQKYLMGDLASLAYDASCNQPSASGP